MARLDPDHAVAAKRRTGVSVQVNAWWSRAVPRPPPAGHCKRSGADHSKTKDLAVREFHGLDQFAQ
jgi:hypothetical protein